MRTLNVRSQPRGVFGRRLSAMLLLRGWTAEKLAGEAGLSVANTYRLVRGQREPSFAVACALADALEVGVEDFRDR